MATEPETGSAVVRLDPAADLHDFVAEHYGRLIRLAMLVTRSVEEAEDAVQTAFERAWRQRTSLKDPSRLRPWLDRIVVREAIRGAPRPMGTLDRVLLSSPERDTSHETAAVHQALDRLAPRQRAVVVLHLYAGYSVADTASALSVPVETVRSRLRVARDRLRHLLAEED